MYCFKENNTANVTCVNDMKGDPMTSCSARALANAPSYKFEMRFGGVHECPHSDFRLWSIQESVF